MIKKRGLFTALEGGSPSLRSDVGTEGREGKKRGERGKIIVCGEKQEGARVTL